MEVKKAGCILINLQKKQIALVYRDYFNDYTFPKGHLEPNETLKECAIRETAEETKRDCKILNEIPPYIDNYVTLTGKHCECHMYIAVDIGKSDNTSTDTHDVIWVNFEDVESNLSYDSLKQLWTRAKENVYNIMYGKTYQS